jgi:hypothetical protein
MVRKWSRFAADPKVGYWLRQRHRGLSVGAAWMVSREAPVRGGARGACAVVY